MKTLLLHMALQGVKILLLLNAIAIPLSSGVKYDPCCSFPCQNNGICYSKGYDDYACDCTRTGYYGPRCESEYFSTTVKKFLKPSRETLQQLVTNYPWLWNAINKMYGVRKFMMKLVLKVRTAFVPEPAPYIGMDEYTTWETYTNKTVYARTLPPIPENCPTPMGVKGKKELPDAELLAKKFFLRREFIPCPRRTNLIFPFFAQHFTHQFFKTNVTAGLPFQWGKHSVDISHIYGDSPERSLALRSKVDGKLKVSVINGEHFPPKLEDVSGARMYASDVLEKKHRLVFGHSGFGLLPSFILFSTLWIREHNRVCDILKEEHPEWNDERIFQTARLIVTGETIKIVIEDYVQHLSGFHFKLLYDPEIFVDDGFSYNNQIHLEFQSLYHWHPLMPDTIRLQGSKYQIKDLLFNPGPLLEAGMDRILEDFNTQFAGQVAGGRNQGSSTLAVATQTINDGRKMRFQPFNQYRVKFGMQPIQSFQELTGETEMATELENLYGDIDALELYVGLILERRREKQLFGETLTEMGAPYSLKGLYGNPINSPHWWKPVTFGGERGLNIIKETTLQKLVCRNVKRCPKVSFRVPDEIPFAETMKRSPTDDNTADVLMSIARQPELIPSFVGWRESEGRKISVCQSENVSEEQPKVDEKLFKVGTVKTDL